MLYNGALYLSLHLSKSDIKACGILNSELIVFCMDNFLKMSISCFHLANPGEQLFCICRLGGVHGCSL